MENGARTVKLSNGSIDYVLYIGENGYVQKAYLGKSISCCDFTAALNLSSSAYSDADGEHINVGFNAAVAPSELSSHGRDDKRSSPITVRRGNGSCETDFKYVSHKVYKGILPPSGLPHAHGDNCETAEILLKDCTSELYVTLYITLFADKDIIVKNYVITNKGDKVDLIRAQSMQLDLLGCDYGLAHFRGRWAEERELSYARLHDGAQEICSNYGVTSHYESSFAFLKSANATADYGEVIGFNLIYSGNFKLRCECGDWLGTHVTYGINDEDFCWTLNRGDSFVTPQAVISYSYEGTDKMSQNFHSFILNNLITYKHNREYKPVLFNSWEGCYFDFNTDSIISYIDAAAEIGAELFVLDDGWFGERNGDNSSLGDWFVNKNKIDLHKVINHCADKGLKFGIWFEPEMISGSSELYRRHPDYALCGESGSVRTVQRHQYCLDFTRPETVDEIYLQIKRFLDEYKVDYIKWDYNRTVCEHLSPRLGDRQGEAYHRLTLGYYSLLSRLTEEYPDIMIEGCAGGGARFDMGTLYYAPQIWTSDQSSPSRRLFINYNTSLGYPLSVMGTHVNDSLITDYGSKAVFALFGTYGYEMNPNKLTADERKSLKNTAELYKKYHKKVIEEGVLYHLHSPNEGNFAALQCVSQDKTQSLALIATTKAEREKFRFLRLKGLACSKNYFCEGYGTFSGEYLEKVGLNLSSQWFDEHTFKLLIVTQV